MKNFSIFLILFFIFLFQPQNIYSQYLIYDDKVALEAYGKQLSDQAQEDLIAIIKDKEGDPFKRAAAVNILREKFFTGLKVKDNLEMQDLLRSAFRRGGSSFIRIEIAFALCHLDREKYFKDMVPFLLRRIDNENNVISEKAFERARLILTEKTLTLAQAKIVAATLKNTDNSIELQNSDSVGTRNKEKKSILDLVNSVLEKQGDNYAGKRK